MTDVERFRLQRQSIREKHAKVLKPLKQESEYDVPLRSIRQHPRWKEFMEKKDKSINEDSVAADHAQKEQVFGPAFIPSESTIRNDYSQRFIDTKAKELPGNAVKNPFKTSRFEEYPKLRNLIDAKARLLDEISIPPTYLQTDLLQSIKPYMLHGANGPSEQHQFHLSSLLPIKYDVAIIDPPLEAYEWESVPTNGEKSKQVWSWEQISALPIPQIMAKESFIFFWVGSGASDGLERGREVLNKWGFRRCEDIVWIRTNSSLSSENNQSNTILQEPSSSAFHRTAEHCLMGIRGTVRRSTDTRFVHCNIDTDVILWPGEAADDGEKSDNRERIAIDMRSKPPEMMDLIENFCLGTRRLELFGRNRNLRRGWLTIGLDVGPDKLGWKKAVEGMNACAAINGHSNNSAPQKVPIPYFKEQYDSAFYVDRAGCTLAERGNLVPYDEKIDDLRPKSPKSNPNQRRERTNTRQDSPYQVNSPVGGAAYFSPSNVQITSTFASPSSEMQMGNAHHQESMTGFIPQSPMTFQQQHLNPGGAGLSGLGAGGRSVVSVPSGSELLSGAQASVMLGQGQRPTNASAGGGPSGLSRRTRRGA